MRSNPFSQKAYKFYPKGVSELLADRYCATEEYNFFRKKRAESYQKNLGNWGLFLSLLKETFAESNITSFDFRLPNNERSFPVCITLTRNNNGKIICRNIVFHLSTLVNYYTIYQTDPLASKANHDFVSFYIDKEFIFSYETLLSIAQKTFPNYSLFPIDLINAVIPDIMFDSIGIIEDKSSKTLMDFKVEMTNYHAFFSSEFYYNI